MRQGSRRSLVTVAAASGVLATLSGGTAYADSGAQGGAADSPGVASGNNVQVPVHVPVNLCGNTANVVGLLNPAAGNRCSNDNGGRHGGSGHGGNGGGAGAQGGAHGSPGVASGNNVQVPVDVPVNACGNSVDVIGGLNPALGNKCENGSGPAHETPAPHHPAPHHPAPERPAPHTPAPHHPAPHHPAPERPAPHTPAPHHRAPQAGAEHNRTPHRPQAPAPQAGGQLAHTGSGPEVGLAAPLGAGLIIGGFVLYRRSRVMRQR